jgi:hypothetical protein
MIHHTISGVYLFDVFCGTTSKGTYPKVPPEMNIIANGNKRLKIDDPLGLSVKIYYCLQAEDRTTYWVQTYFE